VRILWLAIAVVVTIVGVGLVVALVGSGDTSVLDVEVGDCFDLPRDDAGDITSVDVVDCEAPHQAEVVLVGELDPDGDRPYPDDEDLFDEIERRCTAVAESVGDDFGILPVAPNEASWVPFSGRFSCVAIPFGGGRVTGSIAAG
jgi:hypothetical protein